MGLNENEIAYAAGLFDGEGCILICRNSAGSYWLQTRVTNTNRDILEWMKHRFGGGIGTQGAAKGHKRVKPCWYWIASGNGAAAFLVHVFPHLIIKRAQARVAMQFQDRLRGTRGVNHLPLEEVEIRENFKRTLSAMKR
jgi:hypothetical protein